MNQLEVKEIDDQGRVIIPKSWRDKHLKNKKVIMKLSEESVEIVPYSSPDLTKYFDKMEVDVKSSLTDWNALRKELRRH